MVDWIIFYDDGSTFSDEDGMQRHAPREGVQVIAVRDEGAGRRLLWNQDTYCWEEGGWVPHCDKSCERYLNTAPQPIRLRGYWVDGPKFWAIYKRAIEDDRLPPKTGLHPREAAGRNAWGSYGNEQT